MTRINILDKLETVINSFIISLIASFLRLIFYKNGSWLQTCIVFFGGTLLGTFTGYLIDGIQGWESFSKIIIAASAIAAKEIIEFIIKYVPDLLKKFITKKIDAIDGSGAGDNTGS